jgi:hypothetical protein
VKGTVSGSTESYEIDYSNVGGSCGAGFLVEMRGSPPGGFGIVKYSCFIYAFGGVKSYLDRSLIVSKKSRISTISL